MEKPYTFPKTMRLGGRGTFSAIFDRGVKQSRGPLMAVVVPNDVGHPRLGIGIPKRVGTAPKRNRIKRLIRESFRLIQHDFPRGYDVVIVVRPHDTAILADYQRALSALMVKAHQTWEKRAAGGPPLPSPQSQSQSPPPREPRP